MNKKEYQALISECYQKMYAHYQKNFFFGTDGNAQVKHLQIWIEALVKARIPSKELPVFVDHILFESEEFKNKIPNPNSFVSYYREWSSLKGENATDFDIAFNNLYKKMTMRYERLFGGAGGSEKSEHRRFWKAELSEYSEQHKDFIRSYERVRGSTDFRQYPPNIDQFIEILKISSYSSELLTPEEAFEQASSFRDADRLHPIVRHTRSSFGYISLIDKKNRYIKDQFISKYRENLEKFIAGQLNLASQEVEAENEPLADVSSMHNMLDNLLNDLN